MTFQVPAGEGPPQPLDSARGREPGERLEGFGSGKGYEDYAEQQERQGWSVGHGFHSLVAPEGTRVRPTTTQYGR